MMQQLLCLTLLAATFRIFLPAASGSEAEKADCELSFYTLKPRNVYSLRIASNGSEGAPVLPEKLWNCYFLNDRKWNCVTLQPGKFSDVMHYRGSADVSFFNHQPEEEAASGEATAEVHISPGWKKALVILFPGAGEGEEKAGNEDGEDKKPVFSASCYEWKVLEDASLRLLNQTQTSLEIMIDETEVHLAPGQSYDYSLGQAKGIYIPMKIHEIRDGESRLVFSRKQRLDRESRMLLLLQRERGDSGRLRVSTLSLDSDEP